MNDRKIGVAIVEDERATRENFVLLLQRTPGVRCVGAYGSGEHALQGVATDRPDVVLLDIELPGFSGIECIGRLRSLLPDLRIVMLSKFEDADKIFQALKAGAAGYLSKRTPPEELGPRIREAYEGGAPISPQIASRIVEYFNHRGEASGQFPALSRREVEVLQLLAQGLTYKEIADRLAIGAHTVNDYTKSIYAKLHVRSRAQAVAKFLGR